MELSTAPIGPTLQVRLMLAKQIKKRHQNTEKQLKIAIQTRANYPSADTNARVELTKKG